MHGTFTNAISLQFTMKGLENVVESLCCVGLLIQIKAILAVSRPKEFSPQVKNTGGLILVKL